MSSLRNNYPHSLYDVPLPTNITITPAPQVTLPASRRTPINPPFPLQPIYPISSDTADRSLSNFPATPNILHTPFTNSRQDVVSSNTRGASHYHPSTTTTSTTTTTTSSSNMFTPPTVITQTGAGVGEAEHPNVLEGFNPNTFTLMEGNQNTLNSLNVVANPQAPADSHTSYTTPSSSATIPPPPNQATLAKVPLFFLHPVANSNILTVMRCMQPIAQDILIDSREVSPFLPLLGCFFICTMEEREIMSIFPMSKPILRWGIYHKVTRNLLFSSFYRFNCAFGAKGFFTYDAFIDKGHFGFGQEEVFVLQEDVKEKLWKMCLILLREKFGVSL